MGKERSASRNFRRVAFACASLAVVLGLMTFIGWISAMPLLASVRAKYIPMAPSTALTRMIRGQVEEHVEYAADPGELLNPWPRVMKTP